MKKRRILLGLAVATALIGATTACGKDAKASSGATSASSNVSSSGDATAEYTEIATNAVEQALAGIGTSITTDFKVSTSGVGGVVLFWTSSDPTTILFEGSNATVTRPGLLENDKTVTLTVRGLLNGDTYYEKNVTVTVPHLVDESISVSDVKKLTAGTVAIRGNIISYIYSPTTLNDELAFFVSGYYVQDETGIIQVYQPNPEVEIGQEVYVDGTVSVYNNNIVEITATKVQVFSSENSIDLTQAVSCTIEEAKNLSGDQMNNATLYKAPVKVSVYKTTTYTNYRLYDAADDSISINEYLNTNVSGKSYNISPDKVQAEFQTYYDNDNKTGYAYFVIEGTTSSGNPKARLVKFEETEFDAATKADIALRQALASIDLGEEVLGVISYDIPSITGYTIDVTSSSDAITIADGKFTTSVPEKETEVVLTFNVKDSEGTVLASRTKTIKLLAALTLTTHADYIKAESGAKVTLAGEIIAINMESSTTANFIMGDQDGGYYIYNMSVSEDATESWLKIGNRIVVKGTMSPYKGLLEVTKASLVTTAEYYPSIATIEAKSGTDMNTVLKALTDPTSVSDVASYQGQYVTVTGTLKAEVGASDTSATLVIENGDTDIEVPLYWKYWGEGTPTLDKTVEYKVTGIWFASSNAHQLIITDLQAFVPTTAENVVAGADEAVQDYLDTIIDSMQSEAVNAELVTSLENIPGVTIAWSITGEGATLDGNKLTINPTDTVQSFTITATFTVIDGSDIAVSGLSIPAYTTATYMVATDFPSVTYAEFIDTETTATYPTGSKLFVQGVVVYANTAKKCIVLQDADGRGYYIYYNDKTDRTSWVGKEYKIYGTKAVYNDLIQLSYIEKEIVINSTAVDVEPLADFDKVIDSTAADKYTNYMTAFVHADQLLYDGTNFITADGNTIAANNAYTIAITAGKVYDVTAVVGIYKGTYQLQPTKVTEVETGINSKFTVYSINNAFNTDTYMKATEVTLSSFGYTLEMVTVSGDQVTFDATTNVATIACTSTSSTVIKFNVKDTTGAVIGTSNEITIATKVFAITDYVGENNTATLAYDHGSETSYVYMIGNNDAETLGLVSQLFTVTGAKNDASTNVGLSTTDTIKIYANRNNGNGASLTIAISEFEGYSTTINSITLTFAGAYNAYYTVNGTEVGNGTKTSKNGTKTVDVNASSVVIQNSQASGTSNINFDLVSITIDYTVKAN